MILNLARIPQDRELKQEHIDILLDISWYVVNDSCICVSLEDYRIRSMLYPDLYVPFVATDYQFPDFGIVKLYRVDKQGEKHYNSHLREFWTSLPFQEELEQES